MKLLEEISGCRTTIRDALREVQSSNEIVGRTHSFLNVLSFFEIEILSELEAGEQIVKAIEVYLVMCCVIANFSFVFRRLFR